MILGDDRLLLTDLLGAVVVEGEDRIGHVIDARFVIDGSPGVLLSRARLLGVIVGPRPNVGFLGYERRDMRAPAPLAAVFRRRERGAHLVASEDLVEFADDRLRVREGHTHWSANL